MCNCLGKLNKLSHLKVLESHFFHDLRGVGFNEVNEVVSEKDRRNGAILPDDGRLLSMEKLRDGDSVHSSDLSLLLKYKRMSKNI
jgi:hypothetical protein